MNLLLEHKISLKYYAATFFLFGLLLLICGTMFEHDNSELGAHQETMYRQDQVHYWAGIPFIILAIISALFIFLEYNFLLKFCICLDFICLNIAIFVIVVEGPDWKKYQTKSYHYDSSGDVDYLMLKPQQDYGSNEPLEKSYYTSAMYYSGIWVFVAICSILLAVETFLTHIKVYCGMESIYGYLSGYELVHPEITLKLAQPIERFACKGCQTKPPTPTPTRPSSIPIIKEKKPVGLRSPATVIKVPIQESAAPEPDPKRSVSPTPSDASDASNAFYVCQECDGIKLVGYKPRRRDPHVSHLDTHVEEEENPTDYYHFSRKHPNEVATSTPTSDPQLSPSIPRIPPFSPMDPQSAGDNFSRKHPNNPSHPPDPQLSPNNNKPPSKVTDPGQYQPEVSHVSPTIPGAPPLPPLGPQYINKAEMDRSPGKYPSVVDIFPQPPSSLGATNGGRERGRLLFLDPGAEAEAESAIPGSRRNSKQLETLF